MNKKAILGIVLSFIISCSVFFIGYTKAHDPVEVYRVYLDGKSIGLIHSKKDLEVYIDKEEQTIKQQFNVDKVYIPNNLDIVKEITYNEDIASTKTIYDKIKEHASFTIKGYRIKIKGVEEITEEGTNKTSDVIINVLDKDVFIDSVTNTINCFVENDGYDKFTKGMQEEVKEEGTLIEDIYLENEITIKETRISTKEQIFLDSETLSKYLLFGTLEEQETYFIKDGDTITDVSFNNKLSVEEFLIANTQFNSEDNLLYPGQEVVLGVIKPSFRVIEEIHEVAIETQYYNTFYEDDPELAAGIEIVKQEGEDGINKVTRKIKKANGDIISVVTADTETIKPSVDKLIVRGKKVISGVGNLGVWAWPTVKPYVISSNYGWRWGKMHEGIDISGCGFRSPIYAVNNGIVAKAGYTGLNGNYIIIDHQNGYYSMYAHMDSIEKGIKAGQVVEMGQIIGRMGRSGYAIGVHLHFSIFKGYPYVGGYSINPLGVLKR